MARRGPERRSGLLFLALLWVVLTWAWPAHALPGGSPDVRIAPAPAWAERVEVPHKKLPEQQDGQSFLLLDIQRRAVGAERVRFVRGAVRVTSQVGVQDAAQRKFYFDPPHERLVVHRLEVQRGDTIIPHLDRRNIQVLQREPGLENSVYDGTRTAVAVIPDVRIDDVIVYEYSVVGTNPVLEGHVMDGWQLAAPMEIGSLRYRLVTDRVLSVGTSKGAPQPERRVVGSLYEYRWSAQDVPAVVLEEHMPADHDPLPWVQLTDFGSWREVAEWGARLFPISRQPGPRVRALAKEIRTETEDHDAQTLAVLRRVQDDVRYFSLSFGESSHRPANPEVVLERRFGDCKDKAYLMASLLGALGIEASPALVSTSEGLQLSERLPSTSFFDHVIVLVGPVGRGLWLDPTRLYQRGRFTDVLPRGFHNALVLAPGQTDLSHVPELVDERPDVHAALSARVETFGGPVSLDVKTTYTGYRAEAFRSLRASSSKEELNDAASEEVLRAFPRARRVSDAIIADDEATNSLSVAVSFSLADAWVKENGTTRLAFYPPWLDGQLPAAPLDRRHPLALEYPLLIVHDVEITMPGGITVDERREDATPGPFTFNYHASKRGDAVRLHYELVTHARRVEVGELAGYRSALAKISQVLEFQLEHNAALVGMAKSPVWLMVVAVFWTLGMFALAGLIHRRRPYLTMKSVPWEPALAGRRGWLMLMGLGVTLAPLRVLYSLVSILPVYSRERWAALTVAASPEYHAIYAPLLTTELLANITLLIGVGHFAYLYWAKHRSFPLVFASVQAFSFVFTIGDEIAASGIPSLAAQPSGASQIGSLLSMALWTGYALWSKRVKATFLPSPAERRRELRREKRAERRAQRD